ncbi:MAG: UDP-N-acetylmuramate--L-alanine ligase, partial [Clostridia bacterium]|nr:UDP-N-acetylmuramate--L-alanine ligase [Clostridia bacterium]
MRARAFPHTMSFGLFSGDVRAEGLHATGEKYRFTVVERGIPIVKIRLNVVGKFQVMNALAAYAVARLCGLRAVEIKEGLESFRGVKRRFEEVGTICNIPVVCDYAHHPRELAATIAAAQAICEGMVHVVFQPHTYTRTRDFMREFVSVLKTVESPIVYKTYAAREEFDFEGSAVALVSRIPEACYVQSPEQLLGRLKNRFRAGDMILVLGAGDIDGIARSLLDKE